MKYSEILKGLPEHLVIKFNKMNDTARQYTLQRVLGFNKVDSMRNAGSQAKDNRSLSSTAQSLEERNPIIEEIVEYCQQHNFEKDLLSDDGKLANSVEHKEMIAKEQQLNHAIEVMRPDMAESINFYRRVANGSIRKYKTTEKYDADGKLIGKTREVIDDPVARMAARDKMDKLLGLTAIQTLGQVQVGSISINIVDASKDEDDLKDVDFQSDAVVSDEEIDVGEEKEIIIEKKVEKPKKEDNRLPQYYIDENGNRRRRPSWER